MISLKRGLSTKRNNVLSLPLSKRKVGIDMALTKYHFLVLLCIHQSISIHFNESIGKLSLLGYGGKETAGKSPASVQIFPETTVKSAAAVAKHYRWVWAIIATRITWALRLWYIE